jgi:hypothetical protein
VTQQTLSRITKADKQIKNERDKILPKGRILLDGKERRANTGRVSFFVHRSNNNFLPPPTIHHHRWHELGLLSQVM